VSAELRALAEKAKPETKGRWRYRVGAREVDPTLAYVEWGEPDEGYGTALLTKTMARYIAAASPDVILALLDRLDELEARCG